MHLRHLRWHQVAIKRYRPTVLTASLSLNFYYLRYFAIFRAVLRYLVTFSCGIAVLGPPELSLDSYCLFRLCGTGDYLAIIIVKNNEQI